jgi:lipoprotein-anchoring transpeptidase ErfK/SrfK
MRQNRQLITCNKKTYLGLMGMLFLLAVPVKAQMYYQDGNYSYQYGNDNQAYQQQRPGQRQQPDLQYDQRDAEMILRDQVERSNRNNQGTQRAQQSIYDNHYGHRISDEASIQRVMAEARNIAGLIKNRNGKSFIIFDKRNVQFYLYDRNGRLLRIGPAAIGKGRTEVGAFETPVGVFPIKSKVPVDDWVRPDWYFKEEGEPIPQRHEDRRVPGFFRYKLVFEGARYIHYAEATGGRLTHGCLGLDWEDAEAVYHTLDVGSYCIIVDSGFISKLARGEFPIQKPPAPKPSKPEEASPAITAKAEYERRETGARSDQSRDQEKFFRNLW